MVDGVAVVPLKLTQALHIYRGAVPDTVGTGAESNDLLVKDCVAVVSTISPAASGKLIVLSVLLLGAAMVNVPVPDGSPDNANLDNLIPLYFYLFHGLLVEDVDCSGIECVCAICCCNAYLSKRVRKSFYASRTSCSVSV